jgi:hypothetical protein
MGYRQVLFTVPIEEPTDDPKLWIARELAFEGLVKELHAASVATVPSSGMPETDSSSAA